MQNDNRALIDTICVPKYLQEGEDFRAGMKRQAHALKDSEEHYLILKDIYLNQRFLNAGRIQASIGSARKTTAFNCFVSAPIEDSMRGILSALSDAAETMRLGGGDGFDFSTLRPKGDLIKSLGSTSSGPVSFMGMWDAMCETIKSAGHRRGAMMAVLRVDHPDIEEFITCKSVPGKLTNFNISVMATDEFMSAVRNDEPFDLKFGGRVYKTVSAKYLWDRIMRNTWDHAEPGVLFVDTINNKNNLSYCEVIAATNPCAEQPLPPNGACLLGSFNLTKYLKWIYKEDGSLDDITFDWGLLGHDIPHVVRALDNVVDRTVYPLASQEQEAKNKRRMGIGVTGVANTGEILGYEYGSEEFLKWLEEVLVYIRDNAYRASISLALEKGPFPLFHSDYLDGQFIRGLPEDIRRDIGNYGIRNSHLLSIAPTGTISLWAGNISSGIEPPYMLQGFRKAININGVAENFYVEDWAYSEYGIESKTAVEISVEEHLNVLITASKFVDSACSKTCNVGDHVSFSEFEELYMKAWIGGASGCTTFRPAGFREGIMESTPKPEEEGLICTIDPVTGERSCAD